MILLHRLICHQAEEKSAIGPNAIGLITTALVAAAALGLKIAGYL
jgi:hypothetical protein